MNRTQTQEVQVARNNYKHEKRQKDLARQKKQEEKRKRRLEKKMQDAGEQPETAPQEEAGEQA